MEKNENILDSGEIYKNPDDDFLDLPILELEQTEQDSIDWKSLLSNPSHRFTGQLTHRKTIEDDEKTLTIETHNNKLGMVYDYLIWAVSASTFYFLEDFVLASLFLVVLILMLLKPYYRPILHFSKKTNCYWKSAKFSFRKLFNRDDVYAIEFEDIKAIQLLKKNHAGENYSSELNLVLKNNQRINVTAHRDKMLLANDGEMLAKFIGVPFLVGDEKHKTM